MRAMRDGAFASHQVALAFHQGVEGWVGAHALSTIAMPWDHFLGLLAEFEDDFDEDVLTQLSRIRQMGENADVPGNDAAGAGHDVPNQVTIADRSPDPDRWSIVSKAKQVELPDGEIIDIHHFLLGVDGRVDDGRRSDDRTVYADLDSLPLPSWLPPLPEGIPLPVPLPIGRELHPRSPGRAMSAGGVNDHVRHESERLGGGDGAELGERCPPLLLPDPCPRHGPPRRLQHLGSRTVLLPTGNGGRWRLTVDSLTELVTRVYGPTGPLTEEARVTAHRNLGPRCPARARVAAPDYSSRHRRISNSQFGSGCHDGGAEVKISRADLVHGEGSEGSFDS